MFSTYLYPHVLPRLASCCRPQARERLPATKRSDLDVQKEMQLHPVHCLLCGTHFHLPHLTNDVALMLPFAFGSFFLFDFYFNLFCYCILLYMFFFNVFLCFSVCG